MTDPVGALGGAMGAFFDNSIVQMAMYALFAYMVLLWIVAAFWAFRDMRDRSENPVLPFLASALVILFLPFFFPFGVMVYRVVRPPERLGDVYERNLAQEALLAEVEAVKTCRGCDRRVDREWIICPWCRTRLHRVCPNCERLVGRIGRCAWCVRTRRPVTPQSRPGSAPAAPRADPPGMARRPARREKPEPGTVAACNVRPP
jgi:hypothetical protein